ncbi:glycosyltransferase family 2 protein [Candidatus Falkowbacteria bacterium]|nr:glycosyltransferase family 2 protein [Candidatus Falkowbacteria bacterium]
MIDFLKIGKATDLEGADYRLYRLLEMLPGFLSWGTLIGLVILSYFLPVWVAYFLLAFDVYWLLLVLYLGIHLIASYRKLKENIVIDWNNVLREQPALLGRPAWQEIWHLVILPTYNESLEVIRPSFNALVKDGYPTERMIVVLATEERGGAEAQARAQQVKQEFAHHFGHFLITVHPDNIEGELKGKGANQAYAGKIVKEQIIDKLALNYDHIVVSVLDIDTVVYPGYFANLTHKFLTVPNQYRASYQPIPVYFNNIWEAPFFSRVAASSNTFWQMMQQIRQEKLATYSSHSMTWRTLVDIGFWSTKMVSEDSRIFWHSYCFYRGDYRVEPLYFPVSMDATMDENFIKTARSLYKQQRRWGWGVENTPYLIFNFIKKYKEMPKGRTMELIFVQLYGFHSWATNALIIAVIGWMPMLLGGDRFNATVLSGNLPTVTRTLMTVAMFGLVLSAILSTLLLPKRPKHYGFGKSMSMVLQWLILPISIIVFGAIPGLAAQTRLMFGRYMGFWVTPKSR